MKRYTYPRISEESYRKSLFHLRTQIDAVMNVFRVYGQNPEVDQAIEELIVLGEQFAMAVRGKDSPIRVLDKPKPRLLE